MVQADPQPNPNRNPNLSPNPNPNPDLLPLIDALQGTLGLAFHPNPNPNPDPNLQGTLGLESLDLAFNRLTDAGVHVLL